ncbi:MAG: porin [bacterium]
MRITPPASALSAAILPLVAVSAATPALFATAPAGMPDDSVARELASLRHELAELRSQQSDAWLTEERAAEVRAIVADVLADARTRTTLLSDGATAGYDTAQGGFFLRSADGGTSATLSVLQQVRWTFNSRNGTIPPFLGTNETHGFQNKRTRLAVAGNVVDPSWSYKIAYYFDYTGDPEFYTAPFVPANGPVLADAWIAKDLGNGFTVTAGQFQSAHNASLEIDAGNLQFIDRSTVAYYFNLGYTQGVKLSWESDALRVQALYGNGPYTQNRAFAPGSPGYEYGLGARVDWKLAGDWRQFGDQQSWRGEGFAMRVGGAVEWDKINTPGGANAFMATVDGAIDFGGANLFAAGYLFDPQGDGQIPLGFELGGGVFVSDGVELVARYEYGDLDGQATSITDNAFSAVTAGANWYFARNRAKLQGAFGYAFDPIVSGQWTKEGASNNWLQDASGEDGQWTVQAQISVSF